MILHYDKWEAWWVWKAWYEDAWACHEINMAHPEPKLKDYPPISQEEWKEIKAEVKEWFMAYGIREFEKEFWNEKA